MAVGCYNLQFTLDTELIVLGGGISESESLVTEIYKRMDILEKADPVCISAARSLITWAFWQQGQSSMERCIAI